MRENREHLALRALGVAAEAALGAGEVLRALYETGVRRWGKGGSELVTEADRRAEAFLLERLQAAFPDHAVVAEESGAGGNGESPCRWYVDPLDGTNNFAHGYPMFAVSLALEVEGELWLGVVYEPLRGELFTALRGAGARRNGRPIRVRPVDDLAQALVATGFPYHKGQRPENNVAEFGRIAPRVRGIRRGGAAALDLAYLAAGRLDGFWEFFLKPWDTAAGVLLVREAGGVVWNERGEEWRPGDLGLIAASPPLARRLLEALRTPAPPTRPVVG